MVTTLDGSMSYLYVNGNVEWSGAHALPIAHGETCSFGSYSFSDYHLYLDDSIL